MTLRLIFLALVVSLCVGASGCASATKGPAPSAAPRTAPDLPEQEEIKFGYYVDAVVCSEFPVLKQENLTNKVAALGARLVAQSSRPDLTFTFRVLNTETVNAFSGPGGFVYVTVGMLDKLESKDELAAVLSHEIGHCCGRHSIKSWNNAQKISQVLTVLDLAAIVAGFPPVAGAGGDLIADVGQRAAYLASVIVYQGYSRSYEYEADDMGLQQMHGAGYDPQAMIGVFNKFITLRQEEGKGEGLVILASHPHLQERIQHARETIARLDSSN